VRQEFSDLTRHAKKRAQDAVVLVMQLIDDDDERTAMLVAVAMHFIDGAAESITDAAYRYARHEQGVDVVLFGTGNKDHVKANVDSILRPALPAPVIEPARGSPRRPRGGSPSR